MPDLSDVPIVLTFEDQEIVIEWPEDHPTAIKLGLNDWTQEQWSSAFMSAIELAADDAEGAEQ